MSSLAAGSMMGSSTIIVRRASGEDRGRATPPGERSSTLAEDLPTTPPRLRLARFGRQGLGAISSHFLPAIVPILARSGQKRSRIGANGVMVYTEWVCHADVMQALAGCRALPR